jgi:hypothetical protein
VLAEARLNQFLGFQVLNRKVKVLQESKTETNSEFNL